MMDIKLVLMTVRILFKKESTEGFEHSQAAEMNENTIKNIKAKEEILK